MALVALRATQDLSTGPLSYTTPDTGESRLHGVRIHFDGAVTQTVTVTVVDETDSNYSTVLATSSLSAATDYTYTPEPAMELTKDNHIQIDVTDSGSPAVNAYATVDMEYGS
jgi:hypothetical protein